MARSPSQRQEELAPARVAGLQALTHVNRFLSLSLDMSEVLCEIARAAADLTGAPVVSFWLADEGTRMLECGAFSDDAIGATYPVRAVSFDHSLIGWIATHRQPLDVPDMVADPRLASPDWCRLHGLTSFYGLPVLLDDALVAVLALNGRGPLHLGGEDRDLLRSFVFQAAVAIRNARLYAESEARRRTAEALAEVARSLAQSLDSEDVARRIADSVRLLLRAQAAVLYLLVPESGALVALVASGDAAPTFGERLVLPRGYGAAGLAVAESRPVVTTDLWTDSRLHLTSALERSPHRAVLAVPLLLKDTAIGAMAVGDPVGRVFTAEEVRLAQAFADHAVVTLENARLFEEHQWKVQELAVLYELSKAVTGQLCTAQLFPAIAEQVGRVMDARNMMILLYDDARRELEIAFAMQNGTPEAGAAGRRYPLARNLVGGVLERRHPIRTTQYAEMCRQAGVDPLPGSLGFRHWLAAPMVAGDDVVGALTVRSAACSFTDANEQLLANIANLAAFAVRSARLYEERTRAYEQLTQTQHQLVHAQKMEAVGRLAGGIAHDFNNLLTVIAGRGTLLLGGMPESPLRRQVELILGTANRAVGLTRQLLAFSRKQVLAPTVFDLNAVLSELTTMLRRLIGENIELVFVPAAVAAHILADRAQIEQMITNLVVNSRDAMPAGGRITVETHEVGADDAVVQSRAPASTSSYVVVAVSDTGVGMDEATSSRMFEPFFTTKESGKGTGLGLSMVYGIVEQHEGFIVVESQPGQGTTLRVYLPRAEETTDVVEANTVVTPSRRGSEIVLLVEDDDGVRELARETLQAHGYTVLEARHPGEALLIAERRESHIHVMVTDVIMPEMNGRELASRLAGVRPEMKVLFMSGYTDHAFGALGASEPRIRLLQKPFALDVLLRAVREVLDGQEVCLTSEL
jgi:signal transduction histidine kinase/ActR/RegA family two-component response regulator